MAQKVEGSSPFYHPIFFARIPEVRFCVSPFFCAKSKLSRKKAVIRMLAAASKRVKPTLNRAPPAAVWWLPGCFARPARCGLRPCVWPQACPPKLQRRRKVDGLSRRNVMKPDSNPVIHPIFLPEFRALNSTQIDGFICQNLPIQTFWKIKHQTQHSKT